MLVHRQSLTTVGGAPVRAPTSVHYSQKLAARLQQILHGERLQVIRHMPQSDIETVCDNILAHRVNSQVGKVPHRILERFSKHLEEARDGRALATA